MRKSPSCRAVLFLILLAATPLLGQARKRCNPGDTDEQCRDRYKTHVEAMEARTRADFESQPAGVDTGGADLATNSKDLSPLMALSALLGQGTVDEGTGTVTYDLNFLIPELAKPGANNAQLKAVVKMEPQISERIRNVLHDLDRDADVELLKPKLGELADTAIRFTYNHTSDSLGRSFAQHQDHYEAMCRKALDMADMGEEDTGMPPPDDMEARRRAAEMGRETAVRLSDVMSAARLESYHRLVDNQPQLNFTAEKKLRDPLAGSDELSVNVTYEGSWRHLNAATKGCAGKWETEECLRSYMAYVDKWKDKIEKGYRFSFSGEYVDVDGESIVTGLPNLAPIVSESARKLVLKAGWGRNFNVGDGEPVQLDLVGSYEDVSDDPKRQDRGIVRLTLTRNVGRMSIPFGIVYANHGEFLAEEGVDERLSAHIGLTFKMPDSGGDR